MQHKFAKKALALLLTLVILTGLFPVGIAMAAESAPEVSFRAAENSYDVNDLMLDTATADETNTQTDSLPVNENGEIRVSIVMEKESALERWNWDTKEIDENAEIATYRSALLGEQVSMQSRITRAIGHKLNVAWNMTLAANAISAWIMPDEMDEISRLPGVKAVIPETKYEPCVVSEPSSSVNPNMATSSPMIGAPAAWAANYTGAGQKIAIIDTGLDTDHQSVDEGAFRYALKEDGNVELMDKLNIAAVLDQLNVYKGYANPTGQIIADKNLTADKLYVSAKIPFGYNYADRSLYLTHDNDSQSGHGSHVAGIAAGNRYIPDGKGGYVSALDTVFSQGVAPDAQIIVMKVFGVTGGGYTSDMVVAVEDALVLGCDSINMSMGSSVAGFTDAALYTEVFKRLEQSDTVISISAGNNGAWAENTGHGYLYAEDVNLQTAAEPGTYNTALTVASVENDGMVGKTFQLNGRKVPYAEVQIYGTPNLLSSLDTSAGESGTELEYVHLDATGAEFNYDGINVMGKVVFVSRGGGMTFKDMHTIAAHKGAIAVVVYNNEPGPGMKMDVTGSGVDIPIVGITQKDGEAIKAASQKQITDDGWDTVYYTGKMTVYKNAADSAIPLDSEYYTMSSFSSWGTPGTLTIKPEITAPGGNIYSINGETAATDQYVTMSGTSMAAPQVAGMAAVLSEYLDKTGLDKTAQMSKRHLIQNLLMSTATPILDKATGLPYSLLQQGAGLANLESVLNAESHITIDGRTDNKVKAELGDDPTRTGTYSFSYTLHNDTDKAQNYLLGGDVYTQNYFEDKASFKNPSAGKAYYTDYTLKQLDAAINFSVDGKPVSTAASDLPDFTGDETANRADAQALLDYATGKRTSLPSNQALADISKDGAVTAYDAELYLKNLNNSSLLLPAGGSVTVSVSIVLTDADKRELDRVYTNGAYIEAWITAEPLANAEGKVASKHSIPVLAFYGNWSDASMFDQMTNSALLSGDYTRDSYFTSKSNGAKQMNFNYVKVHLNDLAGETYLGANPFVDGDTYNPDRNAISAKGRVSTIGWSLIRNAADLRVAIEDASGKTYYETFASEDDPSGGWSYAAAYVPNNGAWYYVQSTLALKEAEGGWQPQGVQDGTEVSVLLQAAPEYYYSNGQIDWSRISRKNALSIPVAVDNTAPELNVETTDDSWDNGRKTIEVTVNDNRYTAAVLLMTPTGGTRLDAKAVNQEKKGQPVTLTFNVTDIWGSEFQIIAVDYAGNMTTKQAEFESDYYGPTATLMGPTTDTENWPDMSSAAQWDTFESNANLDYAVKAEANTGAYATAYGDGYLFYVGYMRKEGRLNYNLYALDYPDMESTILVGTDVSSSTFGSKPIRSMTYVSENGGRLYYISTGTPKQDGSYDSYQLRSMDVATAMNVGATYYFPAYGDNSKLTPTSIAYSSIENAFYLVAYEDNWNGKSVNLYKFALPTSSADIELEYVSEIGVVYSDDAGSGEVNPDLALKADPDRTAIAVGGEYDPEIYVSIRSADGTRDYLYTYSDVSMVNTGLVRAHNDMVVMPSENEENNISRDTAIDLTLTAPSAEVFKGGFLQLSASLRPWCLTDKALTWESSAPAVASVDASGRVTGVSEGIATITVTCNATPSLQKTIDVTVKAPEFKVSFTGTGSDGVSRMADYDFAAKTLTEGNALTDMDGNPILSAASDLGNYGSLWVQDQTEGEYRLHKIDPATGKSIFDSEINGTGSKAKPVLFNDFSYDDGDSSTNDSEWLFATDGQGKIWVTQNREKPNTFNYVIEQEEAPINFIGMAFGTSFEVDGTRFYPAYYLELSTNRLVVNNFSYSELMGWTSSIVYFDLSEQLDYLTNESGRYLDTLTYDPATGSPILAHFNGTGYDIYWLSLDSAAGTATLLNLGTISGYQDVAVYTAQYYGTGTTNTANQAAMAAARSGEKKAVRMTQLPQGSLNAVSEGATVVEENTSYATLTIRAEKAAASGMLTVELDNNLEFVSLTSPAELNSYHENGQTITFGYAASADIAQGSILAVLRLKQADADAEAIVREDERGGVSIGTSETVKFPYQAGTTYTLTYDVNGGSEENRTDTRVSAQDSESFTVSDFTPTRDGYTFLGWAEQKADEKAAYHAGDTITLVQSNPDKTIYAVWEDFRTAARAELRAYYENLLAKNAYTDENLAELKKLLDEGDAALLGSQTASEAQRILTQYKAKMDRVAVKQPVVEPGRPTKPTTPIIPAKPDAPALPFADVSRGQWFYDDVQYVYTNGLMNGTDSTHFAPDAALTRGMLVTILYRMEKEPLVAAQSVFPDVSYTSWYGKAVAWAAANGIVNGYSNGCFGPDDSITREQLAAILYRYARYKGEDVSVGENTNILSYSDAASISGYAVPAVRWACGEGLINGSQGKLMPASGATRAQVAAMIHRFLNR